MIMSERADIVAALQSEVDQLRWQCQLYHTVLDQLTTGLYVYHLEHLDDDRTLRMVLANQASTTLSGVAVEDVLGKTLDENFPGLREQGIPQTYAAAIRTGEEFEFDNVYRDERVIQRALSIRVVPILQNHVVVIFQDVAAHRQAELSLLRLNAELEQHVAERTNELYESRMLLQTFLEYSPMLIYARDLQGRFLLANQSYETLTRCTVQDIIGKHLNEVLPADTASRFLAWDQEITTSGRSAIHEEIFRLNGHSRIYLTARFPIFNTQGSVVAIGGISADITDLKHAEEALRRRDIILETMSRAAERFLGSTNLEANIHQLLADLGTALLIDRAYVFENSPLDAGLLVMSQRWEWCAPGIITQIDNPDLQYLPYQESGFGRWARLMSQGQPIYGNVSTFPMCEQAILADQHICSMAVVPIFANQDWWGFIGFDDCQNERSWSTVEIDMLKAAASLIGAAIRHQQIYQALQMSEAKYRTLFDTVPACLYRTTPSGQFLEVNPATVILLGYPSRAALLAENARNLYLDLLDRRRWQVMLERDDVVRNFEMQLRRPDGSIIWVVMTSRCIRDITGQVIAYEGSLEDITERKTYQSQIEHLAFTDALTGLANRRRLYDIGIHMLDQAVSTHSSVALLYLDLDRFKTFNDTLGHDAGDELLIQVTKRLQQSIGITGLLARIGGDEFALLLANVEPPEVAAIAQSILHSFHLPFEIRGQRVHLIGSIGVAFGPIDGASFSMLLTHADIAMYRAKHTGNGWQIYNPTLSIPSPDQFTLETELRTALVKDQLTLYYQPIIDLITGRMVGTEALVRWPHPYRGLLTPGSFLPVAEETGLLGDLDYWVLRTTLAQLAVWRNRGYMGFVTVNLTTQSLQRPDLVSDVAVLLQAIGVPATEVIIEVTESTALHDIRTTGQILSELRELGIRIALDDFGTGYASLTHLRQLPVDMLKLDHSFTAGIGQDCRDETVMRALLTLGQGLELTVVVEGVENHEQMIWLQKEGCTYAQGYLIGRPMPAHHIEERWSTTWMRPCVSG